MFDASMLMLFSSNELGLLCCNAELSICYAEYLGFFLCFFVCGFCAVAFLRVFSICNLFVHLKPFSNSFSPSLSLSLDDEHDY